MSKATIRRRLITLVLGMVLLVALVSVFFLNRFGVVVGYYEDITEIRIPQQAVADRMIGTLLEVQLSLNELYAVNRSSDELQAYSQEVRNGLQQCEALMGAILNGSSNLGTIMPGMEGMTLPPCREGGRIEELIHKGAPVFAEFRDIIQNVLELKQAQVNLVREIGWYDSAENRFGAVGILVEAGREMENLADDDQVKLLVAEIRRQEKNILQRADQRYIDRWKDAAERLKPLAVGEMSGILRNYVQTFEGIFEKIPARDESTARIRSLMTGEIKTSRTKIEGAANEIADRAREQLTEGNRTARSVEQSARTWITVIAACIALGALFFGWLVSDRINKVLGEIIGSLNDGSEQLVAASTQLAASSQSIAEGASEQAASLEETSASLEEMATMARGNAEHTSQADRLMRNTQEEVGKAQKAMVELTRSMEDISTASGEISKITKTIDEIAFQTNPPSAERQR